MKPTRTFIAVDPGPKVVEKLVALQGRLADTGAEVSWVEPANLHVTLLFLGEVDQRELLPVCRAVAAVCKNHEGFTLKFDTVGAFPTPRRPRILWAGISEGADALIALHADLEPPLLELGCYRREDRPFAPHVTLGRVKADGGSDDLVKSLARQANWRGPETAIREVLVMGSVLTREGPRYSVLSTVKLG